ncbi:MAG TPA: hypothetical protein PKC43_02785 [Phycisphaerales bacterium]|nr:hypothetical protein [Phycisphaerales bacterium]HMP36352.1 hypothetical protein [Phycisphaerales bacterium]
MATTTIEIQKSSAAGRATMKGDPSAGGTRALIENSGDEVSLEIDGSSFPAGTQFKRVSFFPTSDESAGATGARRIDLDTTDSPVTISGRRADGSTVTLFTMTWNRGNRSQPVLITDAEAAGGDVAWFSVDVIEPTGSTTRTWTLDPELVNTSGGSPGWGPTRPATLTAIV